MNLKQIKLNVKRNEKSIPINIDSKNNTQYI